jgi:hypothetical protein
MYNKELRRWRFELQMFMQWPGSHLLKRQLKNLCPLYEIANIISAYSILHGVEYYSKT